MKPKTTRLQAPKPSDSKFHRPRLSLDQGPRQRPPKTGRAERDYIRALSGIAEHVGDIIDGFDALDMENVPTITQLLRAYAEALKPWSRATARKMLLEVDRADVSAWENLGYAMSRQLKNDILFTPVGETLRKLLDNQVALITSLPLEAGERVHRIAVENLEDSRRYKELAQQIESSGEVTKSRATLIARTETSRTATELMQTRALHAGLPHYIWRTAEDGDVRPGHQAMDGKVCRWDSPPTVIENGKPMNFHPGSIWNCRCWPEIVVGS